MANNELKLHLEWLGFAQPVGLVVTAPALAQAGAWPDKNISLQQEQLKAIVGEATQLAAERKVNKIETRLSPGEKADRKRMAQVCAVYSVEPWHRTAADVLHTMRDENTEARRPRPHDKRVWASVEKHPRNVIRQAFEEALRRDPERRRHWVVLVDGEPRQVKAVKAEARRAGVSVTLIVDIVHVLEYLWLAARALFEGSTPEAETWVGHRLLSLLTGRTGGDVAGTIRWWAESRKADIDAAGRKALKTACRYLANRTRTRMMRYADALRDGLPIATGVIEGACRYLVKDRMDRTGACWSLQGAEAVLRLRALRASGDFDRYWQFHRRGADVVLDVLGKDFAGTLVSDGLPALNALDAHGYQRAQCNSHVISRCSEMESEQTRGAVRFPRDVKVLLKDALELGRQRHAVAPEVYKEAVGEVREALAALAAKDVTHPENLKLAKHLSRHQEPLLRFLDDEAIPPTNNLAERELRGAVVTRKIGGCNRSEPHAHAHAVLSSLAQTAHRRGETLTPHVMRWMQPSTAPPS